MFMDFKPLVQLSQITFQTIIGKVFEPTVKTFHREESKCMASGCPIASECVVLRSIIQAELKKENPDMLLIYRNNKELERLTSSCTSATCKNYRVKKVYHKSVDFGKRLPKSALRVYLFLFSIPQEKLGKLYCIRNLSMAAITKELNITEATVQQSLNVLERNYYITYSHAYSNKHFNIILRDYENMFLPAKRGGSGYITVSGDNIKRILSIKHVNDLRLELYTLLRLDEAERTTGTPFTSVSIHDLKHTLPQHQNYTGHTFEGITQKQVHNGKLELTSPFSMRFSIDIFRAEKLNSVMESLLPAGITLSEEQQKDVAKLTVEYTIPCLVTSICEIFSNYYSRGKSVQSFGALLRRICISSTYAAA